MPVDDPEPRMPPIAGVSHYPSAASILSTDSYRL